MSELVRRATGALARHRAGHPAVSTARVAFDGVPLRWADLPQDLRASATSFTSLVAECAVVAGDDGDTQHGLAWRAFEDCVHTVAVTRPMRPGRDGDRVRLAGPWRAVGHDRRSVVGRVRRREGVVGADIDADPAGGADDVGRTAHVADEGTTGARASAYLPAAVRAGMRVLVPVAGWYVGDIVQEHRSGRPLAQTVTVLRADAGRAVVVRATRRLATASGPRGARADALARTPWFVEQHALDLGPDADNPSAHVLP